MKSWSVMGSISRQVVRNGSTVDHGISKSASYVNKAIGKDGWKTLVKLFKSMINTDVSLCKSKTKKCVRLTEKRHYTSGEEVTTF